MPRERASRPRRRSCGSLAASSLFLIAAAARCNFPDYGFVPVAGGGSGAEGGSAGDPTAGGAAASIGGAGGLEAGAGGTGAAGDAGAAGAAGLAGSAGAGGTDGVLFDDDFESGSTANWFETNNDWEVVSSDGSMVYRQPAVSTDFLATIAGDDAWTDVVVEARIKVLSFGGETSSDLVGLYARFASLDETYYVALRGDGRLGLRSRIAGANSTIGTPVNVPIETGVWYAVRFELVGSSLKVFLDGDELLSLTDSAISAGRIALGTDNATAEFDDVVVRLPP